jgi:3-hydroxyisobutyrate dehydrogenase-like beta-hydroxyacid dehydrogenase
MTGEVTIGALVVGIVCAGAMGSALGARLRDGGARALVALEGRSDRTRRLAGEAGLEDVGALGDLVGQADVLLSVVPPESATDVATAIAAEVRTSRPLVADLNAVSPGTMERVAAVLANAGLETVDGSISGPPPRAAGTTRLYLSGPRAGDVAALPLDGVERVVVGAEIGLASAVKMCTASVYKGRVALLAQAFRTAESYGVVEHVLDDLAGTGLADRDRTGATLGQTSAKAWRYVGEMQQIAATQSSAGLTPKLFEALAEVYADLASRAFAEAPEDVADDVPLAQVLERLTAEAGGRVAGEALRRGA